MNKFWYMLSDLAKGLQIYLLVPISFKYEIKCVHFQ